MNQNGAFSEYARILKDTEDWITDGYRQRGEDFSALLPSRNAPEDEESSHPLAFRAPEHVGPETGAKEKLLGIVKNIRSCENCNLYLIRKNTVPGRGLTGAKIMVVTPPPAEGAEEEGTPLPMYENEYLGKWLTALKLDFEQDVFITPAVKCRTPGGRPPHTEEVAACADYLRQQYSAVAPRAVLALGDAACGALTGDSRDFPALVGKNWTWGSIPALVLWTPAEVLAHPKRLRKQVWDALQRLQAAWNALPGTRI